MDRSIMFTWRVAPLRNDKYTKGALRPSEDCTMVACRHCGVVQTRRAAKPFSISINPHNSEQKQRRRTAASGEQLRGHGRWAL